MLDLSLPGGEDRYFTAISDLGAADGFTGEAVLEIQHGVRHQLPWRALSWQFSPKPRPIGVLVRAGIVAWRNCLCDAAHSRSFAYLFPPAWGA